MREQASAWTKGQGSVGFTLTGIRLGQV